MPAILDDGLDLGEHMVGEHEEVRRVEPDPFVLVTRELDVGRAVLNGALADEADGRLSGKPVNDLLDPFVHAPKQGLIPSETNVSKITRVAGHRALPPRPQVAEARPPVSYAKESC